MLHQNDLGWYGYGIDGHLIALARAVKTDSGLSAIYDLQAPKRSYCQNAIVVLINVDLIGRCHDTIVVGDEAVGSS